MWDVTKEIMERKLKSHKNSAKRRGINCTLTLKELTYVFTQNKGFCDYTGEVLELVLDEEDDQTIASIERIDEHKGYSIDNILLVRRDINTLKSWVLETKSDFKKTGKLTIDVKELLNRVCEVVFNPVKLKEVQSKYLNYNGEIMKEVEEIQVTTQKQANPDVKLAKEFFTLGEMVSTVSEFELSFAQYKSKMKRVKCSLTGKKFTEEDTKALFWLDKTKPFNKDNTLVTTKVISEALDNFMANTKLSLTELKSLCKVISK